MAKQVRCYLGFHRWRRFRNDAGEWYAKCRNCGKYSEKSERNFMPGG